MPACAPALGTLLHPTEPQVRLTAPPHLGTSEGAPVKFILPKRVILAWLADRSRLHTLSYRVLDSSRVGRPSAGQSGISWMELLALTLARDQAGRDILFTYSPHRCCVR